MVRWKKILAYSLLLFVLQTIPTTLTTYFLGVPEEYTYVRFLGEYIAIATMSFIVFLWLATLKLPRPYWHAICVTALAYLIAAILVAVLLGEFKYTVLSAIENTSTLIGMFLGTFIGLAFVKKSARHAAT